jgi:hypothetical protein
LLNAATVKSQESETGITILDRNDRMLKIDANRPLDAAAFLLAQDYTIHINAEDSPLACSNDVIDTRPSQENALAADHFYLPKGGHLEVLFPVDDHRHVVDAFILLDRIVNEANRALPYRYRLHQENGEVYSLVPIEARDQHCRLVKITSLLDHRISLPKETRGIFETIRAFDSALTAAAGEQTTTNTQSWMNRVADFPISIGAQNTPAREILLTIIRETHYRFYWLAREQPFHSGWTINLLPLTRPVNKEPGGSYSYSWIPWSASK